jgi:NAD(P)-dependent dehydrogenase (short-subunit alcohol dehydrogenase family)
MPRRNESWNKAVRSCCSVGAAAERMGGITLAVNCAGVATAGRALGRDGTWPTEIFNRVIQINLVGTFNVTKETAAVMNANDPNEDGERGVIISTASIAAFEGQIGQAAYAASKGGVHAMMLPLAREFAQFGIRVNTIAPGIMLTPMMSGMPQEVQDSLAAQVPFPKRLGRPQEYADTVQFIYETTYVNSETIRCDGAIRMQAK